MKIKGDTIVCKELSQSEINDVLIKVKAIEDKHRQIYLESKKDKGDKRKNHVKN